VKKEEAPHAATTIFPVLQGATADPRAKLAQPTKKSDQRAVVPTRAATSAFERHAADLAKSKEEIQV